jgi:adenosylhomocysteine nucleosidase
VSNPVVILFALDREAAPFRRLAANRPGVRIGVTGVGANAARRAAEEATRHAVPPGLIMAGFCGALRSGLAVGDVVTASEVIDERGGRWACQNIGQPPARLLTATALVASPFEKHRLASRHHADIVDMESAVVAAVCHARGVPFLAVRAVSDAADTSLSPRLVKLLSGAKVSPARAALAVFRQPSLIAEFRRLARDTRLAAKALAVALTVVLDPRDRAIQAG